MIKAYLKSFSEILLMVVFGLFALLLVFGLVFGALRVAAAEITIIGAGSHLTVIDPETHAITTSVAAGICNVGYRPRMTTAPVYDSGETVAVLTCVRIEPKSSETAE